MHLDFLQIGAHVGNTTNDHIFKRISLLTRALLIEPVPFLFEQLKNNYLYKFSGKEGVVPRFSYRPQFLNAAVSNYDGILKLYVPSKDNDYESLPFWISQLASTHPDHIQEHLRVCNIDVSRVKIDELEIECFRLNTLIAKYGITSIKELHVDTEGHDYEILMDLDLAILKPAKIVFENKHMDGIFQKGKRYGALIDHYMAHGYKVISETSEDTCMVLYK
jgi:FkbM family methyltransferase